MTAPLRPYRLDFALAFPFAPEVHVDWARAAAGGAMIGGAAALLLLFNGRVAGVSGIAAGMFSRDREESGWRVAFIAGLLLGGFVAALAIPEAIGPPVLRGTPWVIAAGLLVGVGTRLANGCTSGHGVCGIARLSPRSLLATAVFMGTGALTVFVVRRLLGGAVS